jgi:hypothetical protein
MGDVITIEMQSSLSSIELQDNDLLEKKLKMENVNK